MGDVKRYYITNNKKNSTKQCCIYVKIIIKGKRLHLIRNLSKNDIMTQLKPCAWNDHPL